MREDRHGGREVHAFDKLRSLDVELLVVRSLGDRAAYARLLL